MINAELINASKTGDIRAVRSLLTEIIVDVETKDNMGNTPLILAVVNGHAKVVKLLLEQGADVNAKTIERVTSLMSASIKGHTEIAKLLIEKGADVNARDINEGTVLMYGLSHTEIVKLLLEKGVDVNAKNNGEYTALMFASGDGHTDTVKLLLGYGADVNAKDRDGYTSLISAVMNSHIEIVKLLLEKGADVNAKNVDGDTALIIASMYGRTEIIKLLLERGADVNAKTNRSITSLMRASMNDYIEIVKLLLEKGADVNAKDEDGLTAFDLTENEDIKNLLKYGDNNNGDINNGVNLWKGMTRSDIAHLDSIFDEGASNHSLCPICLQYAERQDGCMYMAHDCTQHGKQYHKRLYKLYKNSGGIINWCTICNRIAKGHNHYELSSVTTTTPSVIIHQGNPFETDCSLTNGGGGPTEKFARFRRFREYALDLQDDIGKKSKQEAFEELVEEVWDAPLRREKRLLKKIQNNKAWNISSSAFPLPRENVNEVYPNIPYNGPLPTKVNSGRNNIGMNNNVPILRFVHQQPDGSEKMHGISEENLEGFIQSAIGGFGGEGRSGYCFMYPGCKARLYPQEIKGHIPEELYNIYKTKFNNKFKASSGGGSDDLIQEATDALCLNPKRGGTRNNRKRRQYPKKTKKAKAKAKKTKSRRL